MRVGAQVTFPQTGTGTQIYAATMIVYSDPDDDIIAEPQKPRGSYSFYVTSGGVMVMGAPV